MLFHSINSAYPRKLCVKVLTSVEYFQNYFSEFVRSMTYTFVTCVRAVHFTLASLQYSRGDDSMLLINIISRILAFTSKNVSNE
jgi:hypothetical protein